MSTSSASLFNPANTGIWDAIIRSAGDGAVIFVSLEGFLQTGFFQTSMLSRRCLQRLAALFEWKEFSMHMKP
jgi:hypothetical protein